MSNLFLLSLFDKIVFVNEYWLAWFFSVVIRLVVVMAVREVGWCANFQIFSAKNSSAGVGINEAPCVSSVVKNVFIED